MATPPALTGASGAVAAALDARRVHFHHGPIDLVIEAWGEPAAVAQAYRQAWARFDGLLSELVTELAALRRRLRPSDTEDIVDGAVARRMVRAALPYTDRYITPMAAVAGAVADEILAALTRGRALERAYVDNGGDIAIHLAPGHAFQIGLVAVPGVPLRHGHPIALDGRVTIDAARPQRGIATSGWRGRSRSLGIADCVTVVARDAAAADAAATMIANAVDADHAAIARRPACELDDDSDLGALPVTVAVGPLPPAIVAVALERGATEAIRLCEAGGIEAAALVLQGRSRAVGLSGDSIARHPVMMSRDPARRCV